MRRLLTWPLRLAGDFLYEIVLGLEAANDLICGPGMSAEEREEFHRGGGL